MNRTLRTIRRTIRAALHAGRHLITAVRGHRFRVLVALYTAIDTGADLRIAYTDSHGVNSERTITPYRLDVTAAGNITCRAHDWRDGEATTFRTDRITLTQEPPVAITLTKDAVTLYDIQTQSAWSAMSHRDAEDELASSREVGDIVHEYESTDRDGTPIRVVYQRAADTGPDSEFSLDEGGVYLFET